MKLEFILNKIFQEILIEIKKNHNLRNRIIKSIEKEIDIGNSKPIRSHRRDPGPFDPMMVYVDQPDNLKNRLDELSINELKDIIAEHGMDRTKLAMKWKKKERLVDLIMTTVHNRSQKGDAFRTINAEQNIDEEK